eukprot:1527564-Pleurochrysis_carterae.AAC.1
MRSQRREASRFRRLRSTTSAVEFLRAVLDSSEYERPKIYTLGHIGASFKSWDITTQTLNPGT